MKARPPTLYFFHLDGCTACKAASPALGRFEKAHPEIRVARVDIARVNWKLSWQPRMTPTYGWLAPGAPRLRLRGGAHTKKELDLWVASEPTS